MSKKKFEGRAPTTSPMIESLESRELLSHTVSATRLTFSSNVTNTIANPIGLTVSAKLTANGLPLRTANIFFVVDGQTAYGQGVTGRSGYASAVIPNVYAGKHTIAAYFVGATRYVASQSRATSVAINAPHYTTTASGLKYATITAGTGAAAAAGNFGTVDYVGFLTTGSLFDTSIKPNSNTGLFDTPLGSPITFELFSGSTPPVNSNFHAVQGFNEGLIGMKQGETRVLVIPGDLAYGANPPQGSGIPANATLVFYVKMESIT